MIVTLDNGTELTLPMLHFGVQGPPSSGKSHLLASMEKPLLVLGTDPEDKMQPYIDRGELDPKVYTGQFGQPVRLIHSRTSGNAIIQLELFHELNPDAPTAFDALLNRAEQLRAEVMAKRWASVGLDSWTFLEIIAKARRNAGPMKVSGQDQRRGLRIASNAKDDVLSMFTARFVHLPCHVGVVLHTFEKTDFETGAVTRGLKVIGDLKTELPAALGERYLAVNVDGTTRRLDTKNVAFNCCTLIDAPNPCANDFKALFANWIAKRAAQAAQPAADAAKEQP